MKFRCLACDNDRLELLFLPSEKIMITSDARRYDRAPAIYICQRCQLIQKHTNHDYLTILNDIYKNYNSQFILEGEDEFVHSQNSNKTRTSIILENSLLEIRGSLLDIGTGSGVFLKSAKEAGFDCYAHDISDNHHKKITKIIPESKIYYGDVKDIPEKFDVISAIHVLEHITTPNVFLNTIRNKLKKNGKILIQVPNAIENPFDLSIIDHCIHFSNASLYNLLQNHFDYVWFPEKQIYKEITIVASNYKPVNFNLKKINNEKIETTPLKNLYDLKNSIKKPSDIFGTGSPSVLAKELLGNFARDFVDEDLRKIGKILNGAKIVKSGTSKHIVIPFPYIQAVEISKKIKRHYKIIYPENI